MPTPTPSPAQVGRFRYTAPTGRWTWSDGMFRIHGMAPGEVVPTLALMSRHVHPDDRGRVMDALSQCAVDGEPFGCHYRLLDLTGGERSVTLTGAGDPDGDAPRTVSGFLVDVTASQRDAVARRVNQELTQALQSHAVIDQAKGALMLGYGIDGEAAFELLRWGSQQRNVRLLTLSERLVAAVESGGGLGSETRQRLDDFYVESFTEPTPEPPAARNSPTLLATFDTSDGVPVVRIDGPVDLATAHEFTAAVTQLMITAREVGEMVVDLRLVTHLGSVGVSALSAANRRSTAAGVKMRIVLSAGIGLGLVGAHDLDIVTAPAPSRTRLSAPTG
ncbi:ANTAR domain-containing protein [Cellulomonas fengjieae]|uniref:ANTAR domain-containing protein n=1 Tax=Cellulomonas fengjieae TaxID=2819978 RepID=A0ABS3SIS2_9CELL|nr:ANTAR domain-containing protein [Cellulomonas fengjieae]MBO3085642.1 ANTAR domain-containing protein [Cellulomonas fengjieae]QVI67643.1 ANTAR domain-containing protein [Cellulomonas fengjieae]